MGSNLYMKCQSITVFFYLSKVKYAAIMQRLMRYLKIQQCEKKLTEDFMKIYDHVIIIPCHGPGV